uniref:N-acylethanolamine-hydrolyzing acid amidase n=1 Tax=Ditylenchus dipsaci TaxID=166011 RepID=A0A915EST8_9BILA
MPRRYRIDLDQRPEDRWDQVLQDYKTSIPLIIEQTKEIVPTRLQAPLFWIAEKLIGFFDDDYARELRGIAQKTNLPLGHVVGMNILYDITDFERKWFSDKTDSNKIPKQGCTSIVAEDSKGKIFHGRNLDYDMGSLLRNISIIADFTRNEEIVFSANTFVLYVGVLTGQRPNAFTVSMNARYSGGYWDNLFMELVTRFHRPISFEIRKTLENVVDFASAVTQLSSVHLIAPSYIITGGVKSGEGAVITRDRWASADVYYLNSTKGRWFLLETNFDHWKKSADPRRKLGNKYMNEVGQSRISADTMFAVLSKAPVMNNQTIFSTVMSADEPEISSKFILIPCKVG